MSTFTKNASIFSHKLTLQNKIMKNILCNGYEYEKSWLKVNANKVSPTSSYIHKWSYISQDNWACVSIATNSFGRSFE